MTNWKPITEQMKSGGPWLVTNNPKARNAFGEMSHIWVTHFIQEDEGEFICFDGYNRVCGLVLYAEITAPEVPGK